MVTLDHVAFGARDHREAAAAFSLLGFKTSDVSRCEWEISGRVDSAAAVCVVFAREYLDIIEVTTERWGRHLATSLVYQRGFAPTGVVFSGPKAGAAFLHRAGESTVSHAPYRITRCMGGTRPIELEYEFLPLRPQALPFGLIHDPTPDALRRSEWLEHPNGALGLADIHLRVPSLAKARQALLEPPLCLSMKSDDPSCILLGAVRLHLHELHPSGYLGAVSALLPDLGRPALLALEFQVDSVERTGRVLGDRGVAFTAAGGSLVVAPAQGFGTGIVFRGAAEASV